MAIHIKAPNAIVFILDELAILQGLKFSSIGAVRDAYQEGIDSLNRILIQIREKDIC